MDAESIFKASTEHNISTADILSVPVIFAEDDMVGPSPIKEESIVPVILTPLNLFSLEAFILEPEILILMKKR